MATALIADDATIMRVNIKKMIEELGHEVVAEAKNGYEAVDMYNTYLPDFVTMDITMPEVNGIADGIDAVKKIIEDNPKAKIIMVTSHGEQEKVIRAVQAGAKSYLLKPIRYDKLEEVIMKVLTL